MINNINLPPQEWLGYDPERGDIHGYTFEGMREFVESIIRECADIADKAEPYKSNDLILKNFGVE